MVLFARRLRGPLKEAVPPYLFPVCCAKTRPVGAVTSTRGALSCLLHNADEGERIEISKDSGSALTEDSSGVIGRLGGGGGS